MKGYLNHERQSYAFHGATRMDYDYVYINYFFTYFVCSKLHLIQIKIRWKICAAVDASESDKAA